MLITVLKYVLMLVLSIGFHMLLIETTSISFIPRIFVGAMFCIVFSLLYDLSLIVNCIKNERLD
jgi:hypothetical protein